MGADEMSAELVLAVEDHRAERAGKRRVLRRPTLKNNFFAVDVDEK